MYLLFEELVWYMYVIHFKYSFKIELLHLVYGLVFFWLQQVFKFFFEKKNEILG